jgi:hypothetical protein
MLDALVVEHALEIVRIAESNKAVPHVCCAHPHVADPRMKGGRIAKEHQRLFAVVLEFGVAVDVAEQQTNDVRRVGELERVRLGAGNAITDPVGVTASLELFKAANGYRARPFAGRQYHRFLPTRRRLVELCDAAKTPRGFCRLDYGGKNDVRPSRQT